MSDLKRDYLDPKVWQLSLGDPSNRINLCYSLYGLITHIIYVRKRSQLAESGERYFTAQRGGVRSVAARRVIGVSFESLFRTHCPLRGWPIVCDCKRCACMHGRDFGPVISCRPEQAILM